jgi:hypothetical protein
MVTELCPCLLELEYIKLQKKRSNWGNQWGFLSTLQCTHPLIERDKSNMQLAPRIGWTHKSRMPLSWHKRQLAVACYEKKYAWSGQWWLFFYLWQSNICSLQSCLFTCGNQTFVHMFFPLLPFYLWQSNNCSYVLPSPVFLPVAIKHLFICSSQSCVFTCGNNTFVHMFFSVLSFYLWQ